MLLLFEERERERENESVSKGWGNAIVDIGSPLVENRRRRRRRRTTKNDDDELMMITILKTLAHLANTRSQLSPKTPPRYPRPSTLSRTPTTLATGPIPIGGRRECPPRSFGRDCAGRSRRVRRCRRSGLGSKKAQQSRSHHHPLVVVVVVVVAS